MRRTVLAVLLAAVGGVAMAATGDAAAPRFKSPAVREALEELAAAQKRAALVLRGAAADARAHGDYDELARLESRLAEFTDEVDGRDESLRMLMSRYQWTRIVSDGTNMQMSFHGDGTLSMNDRSAWKRWAPRGGAVVIHGVVLRPVQLTVLYGKTEQGNDMIIVPTTPKPER